MKTLITQQKPSAIGAAAVLASCPDGSERCAIKPQIAHASPPPTAVELPAVQFGPLVVQPGQIATLGVQNCVVIQAMA